MTNKKISKLKHHSARRILNNDSVLMFPNLETVIFITLDEKERQILVMECFPRRDQELIPFVVTKGDLFLGNGVNVGILLYASGLTNFDGYFEKLVGRIESKQYRVSFIPAKNGRLEKSLN